MATIAEALLTAEEFRHLPNDGVPRELVRGRVVPLNLPAPRHGYICGRVFGFLFPFVTDGKRGRLVSNDSAVLTEQAPDSVRGPDIAFYSFARIPPGQLPEGYLDVVPELVFEIRSPTDRWSEVLAKTAEYLKAGVITVCVVDPTTQKVYAYHDILADRIFTADEDFLLPEVLGDFRIPVRLFFE
jgi:Uma2 family endonuclease